MNGLATLQDGLLDAWRANVPGSKDEHVVVILPSFSLGSTILSHYRARIGCMEHRYLLASLITRSIPGADIVMVTCKQPDAAVLDYYSRLAFPDHPNFLRQRFEVVVVEDDSPRGLAAKLLDRLDVISELRGRIGGRRAFLEAWNVTEDEVEVAEALGLPLNGTPPQLWPLGFKSRGRRFFREAGVPVPEGAEDVRSAEDLAAAVEMIRRNRPDLTTVVVKHDNSGAGDGNLVLATIGADGEPLSGPELAAGFLRAAPAWFVEDLVEGGIVEEFVRGETVTSPSAQIDIGADGSVRVLSTHEQVLGGDNGQVFVGCRFPADEAYAGSLAVHARSIGELLAGRGVLGRVGIDFVTVRHGASWDVRALEMNLRRGGTTHPYLVLRYLVPGSYDEVEGRWVADDGTSRCYRADDNLVHPDLLGLPPASAIKAVDAAGLAFDPVTRTGVVLHMLSGLAVDGRVGLTAIGRTREEADQLHAAVEPALLRARVTAPELPASGRRTGPSPSRRSTRRV